MKALRRIVLLLAIIFATMSCGAAKLANVVKNLDIVKFEKIELKGLTGLQLSAEVNNGSKFEIAMEGGVIELMSGGEIIATLTQVGRIEVLAHSHSTISTLWKIEGVDPVMMLKLAGKIAINDYSGLSANYKATLSSGKTEHTISGKEVNIPNILAIFTL